jgi:hypothetical protein
MRHRLRIGNKHKPRIATAKKQLAPIPAPCYSLSMRKGSENGNACQLCGKAIKTEKLIWIVTVENGQEQGGFPIGPECLKKYKLGPNEKVQKPA